MEKLQKKDFVEIEFIGKVKNGGIFDTNIEEEAKKININIKSRPLIICLGEGMILPAIDNFLIGKKLGDYTLELSTKEGFGERKRELVKTMSISVFKKQDVEPRPGMVFVFDSVMGRISAVSGGRVIVDFNNPLAGKELVYEIKVKNIVKDERERVKALMRFFFGKELEFEIKEKKIIVEAEKEYVSLIEVFKGKFKDILGLEFDVKEVEKKEETNFKD